MRNGPQPDEHVGAELRQCFIEIVHLCHDGDDCYDQENVCARVRQLVATAEGELEGDSKSLDCANGNAADCAANAEIDQWVLFAILGRYSVDHDRRKDDDEEAVKEEAYSVSVWTILLAKSRSRVAYPFGLRS